MNVRISLIGWVGGCIDGWVDVWVYVHAYVCISACLCVVEAVCMRDSLCLFSAFAQQALSSCPTSTPPPLLLAGSLSCPLHSLHIDTHSRTHTTCAHITATDFSPISPRGLTFNNITINTKPNHTIINPHNHHANDSPLNHPTSPPLSPSTPTQTHAAGGKSDHPQHFVSPAGFPSGAASCHTPSLRARTLFPLTPLAINLGSPSR